MGSHRKCQNTRVSPSVLTWSYRDNLRPGKQSAAEPRSNRCNRRRGSFLQVSVRCFIFQKRFFLLAVFRVRFPRNWFQQLAARRIGARSGGEPLSFDWIAAKSDLKMWFEPYFRRIDRWGQPWALHQPAPASPWDFSHDEAWRRWRRWRWRRSEGAFTTFLAS